MKPGKGNNRGALTPCFYYILADNNVNIDFSYFVYHGYSLEVVKKINQVSVEYTPANDQQVKESLYFNEISEFHTSTEL